MRNAERVRDLLGRAMEADQKSFDRSLLASFAFDFAAETLGTNALTARKLMRLARIVPEQVAVALQLARDGGAVDA